MRPHFHGEVLLLEMLVQSCTRLLGGDHGLKYQLLIPACLGPASGVCCEKVTSNFNQDRRKGLGTLQSDREPATLSRAPAERVQL